LERDQPNPISNVILAYLLWAEEVETELDEYLLKLGVFQKEITKQIKQGGERYVITNLRKQQKGLQYDMHHLGEQALQIGDFVVAVNDAITNTLKKRHEREQKQRDAKKTAKKEEEKKKEQALKEWGVQQPSPSPSKREAKRRRRSRRRGFSPQVSGNPRADVEPRSDQP